MSFTISTFAYNRSSGIDLVQKHLQTIVTHSFQCHHTFIYCFVVDSIIKRIFGIYNSVGYHYCTLVLMTIHFLYRSYTHHSFTLENMLSQLDTAFTHITQQNHTSIQNQVIFLHWLDVINRPYFCTGSIKKE